MLFQVSLIKVFVGNRMKIRPLASNAIMLEAKLIAFMTLDLFGIDLGC